MTTMHKAVFVVSALFAVVWTALFVRIAFPRRRGPAKCSHKTHRWHRIENYTDGRAKARCLACGKVAIVNVRARPPAAPSHEG